MPEVRHPDGAPFRPPCPFLLWNFYQLIPHLARCLTPNFTQQEIDIIALWYQYGDMIIYQPNHEELLEKLETGDKSQPVFISGPVVHYREALDLQLALRKARTADRIPDTVLILEHKPVITVGIRKDRSIMLADKDTLTKNGIEIVKIARGGGATAHNPGQLVIYPILKLSPRGLRVVPYVHFLEELCINLLAAYGVEAETRHRFPGVWVLERKIASLGVELVRGVTMHGVACNMINNLDIFSYIVPCGIEGVRMTSLEKETGQTPEMQSIKKRIPALCSDFFSRYAYYPKKTAGTSSESQLTGNKE
ncbi:MAG: lipoyl(octanoyl) transferase LipB [Spirochaetales bacterium]|nr:lipoyl(octanoyl) transferase LipB [Spirochaetales bacterium]